MLPAVVRHTPPVTMLKEILCLYGPYEAKKPCTYGSLLLALPLLKNSLRGHRYWSLLASGMIKVCGGAEHLLLAASDTGLSGTGPRSKRFHGSWKSRRFGCQNPAGGVYTREHPHNKILLPRPTLLQYIIPELTCQIGLSTNMFTLGNISLLRTAIH